MSQIDINDNVCFHLSAFIYFNEISIIIKSKFMYYKQLKIIGRILHKAQLKFIK